MTDLTKRLIRTIAFFDIFDYPLTLVELYLWLYKDEASSEKVEWTEFIQAIDNLPKTVENYNGFYFLAGRKSIYQTRQDRYVYSQKKWKKAIFISKLFRFWPYVSMIAVCNSLAYNNCPEGSDIDLFIVTSKNKIWLTRLMIVGFLQIFGLRFRPGHKQNTIDPTFFITEDNLNLEKYKISGLDPYLAYWLNQLVPIYNDQGIYQKLMSANVWIKDYIQEPLGVTPLYKRQIHDNWFVKFVRKIREIIFRPKFWEKQAKNYQLKIMPSNLKQASTEARGVILADNILKFHLYDQRQIIIDKWRGLCQELGL